MDKHTDKLSEVSETESYMPVITVSRQATACVGTKY